MSARISHVRSANQIASRFDVREVVFDVSEARRALPYVARLMRDAQQVYQRVQRARWGLVQTTHPAELAAMIEVRDYTIQRLNEIIDECHAVGLAHINIPTGMAAFRSHVRGHAATLLWRVGEPIEGAWTEYVTDGDGDLGRHEASQDPAESKGQLAHSDG